ncbi:MAG TPA: DUF5131 family protein [Candidatus Alectryocaccomicrobium excrementavium]|uniref:DUF5131 family protein n=1 Tax=Candidatus Alectryocaccomicrobium excrementavium TaxID=2840668 RepID=A0A9D1G0W5_9FIRM|nr:DUF5131 family protein [Candidatus Alectryocaccomicrobium excrementavium]
MGKKTKIDWADATWNPVTGCLHGCEYCYAKRLAERFSAEEKCLTFIGDTKFLSPYELEQPAEHKGKKEPYPFGFSPTLHKYRIDEPKKWEKPRTIFVCSMADLFGDWVPDEWIAEVFRACDAAPQHRFLFLTKNPGRYCHLERAGIMPKGDNFWFGATFDHSNWPGHDGPHEIPGRPTTFTLHGKMVHDAGDFYYPAYPEKNRFVSFEPLLYDIGAHIGSTGAQWHIIGAETGNRKGKVATQREWVEHIVEYSDKNHIPVFMKESLRGLMGDDFRQEFPWEV